MKFQVIKTINIDIEEFIKVEQINKDNIVERVDRYCKRLQKIGYKIITSEWSKLCQEIYKKLNKNS